MRRRIAELAADSVAGVISDVPARRWVPSKPIALRLHLTVDPDPCRDVTSAFIDAAFASPSCA